MWLLKLFIFDGVGGFGLRKNQRLYLLVIMGWFTTIYYYDSSLFSPLVFFHLMCHLWELPDFVGLFLLGYYQSWFTLMPFEPADP